jgi:hypothetical protein
MELFPAYSPELNLAELVFLGNYLMNLLNVRGEINTQKQHSR